MFAHPIRTPLPWYSMSVSWGSWGYNNCYLILRSMKHKQMFTGNKIDYNSMNLLQINFSFNFSTSLSPSTYSSIWSTYGENVFGIYSSSWVTFNLYVLFSTECGIYEPNCGLDKVLMSWGHDGETLLFKTLWTSIKYMWENVCRCLQSICTESWSSTAAQSQRRSVHIQVFFSS